jgi:16S rRNA G966 N2-methylase RsmD
MAYRVAVHMFDPELRNQPNKYAEPSGYTNIAGEIEVRGYQSFKVNAIDRVPHPINQALIAKDEILRPWFLPKWFKNRSFLDLGGNNGFFSLRALQEGASQGVVVDIDKNSIENVRKLSADLMLPNLEGFLANVKDLTKPHDIVFALALVHWVFNLTTGYGSLAVCLEHLARLSRDALFIEWVDPEDEVIRSYNHLTADNEPKGINEYNEEFFLQKLRSLFDEVSIVGNVSSTRRIYIAFRRSFNLDFTWSEKLILPRDTLISSRILYHSPSGPIWSRVYRSNSRIVKQVSRPIGWSEYQNLKGLNHPCFPSAKLEELSENTVTFSMPELPGETLYNRFLRGDRPLSESVIWEIAKQLFEAVVYLHDVKITHRDIHPNNVLFDSNTNKVYLVDFGWSASEFDHDEVPSGLGVWYDFDGRPSPQDKRNDLFALGCLIEWLLRQSNQNNLLISIFISICLTFPDDRTWETKRKILSEMFDKNNAEDFEYLPVFIFTDSIIKYRYLFTNTLLKYEEINQKHIELSRRFVALEDRQNRLHNEKSRLVEELPIVQMHLKEKDLKIDILNQEISRLVNSRSMRITKPMRDLYRWMFKLISKIRHS